MRRAMQRGPAHTANKSRTQFIQLNSFWIAVAFITKCLSCLIVKCMLLTFIFNYFVPPCRRSCVRCCHVCSRFFCVLMNLQSRIPSPCTRWIFMLHIHLPSQHAHQRASGNLGRDGKKNLEARGKHWESERRVTIVVSFLHRKYGRKS